MIVLTVSTNIHDKGDDKAAASEGHEQEEKIKPAIIVHADGIVDKGTIMIKNKDALAADATVFGPKWSSHMTSMTKWLGI